MKAVGCVHRVGDRTRQTPMDTTVTIDELEAGLMRALAAGLANAHNRLV